MQPEARAVTRGPKHHFFGYYDKTPWDASGRFLLACQSEFMDRSPTGTEPLTIGRIDLEDECRFTPIAPTTAWHWQVGCHAQWLATSPDRLLIYNDHRDGQLVSVIRYVWGTTERVLPMPIMAINRQGTMALTVDMHRLHIYRPGYGMPGGGDYAIDQAAPPDQGIYTMDMVSGACKRILTLAQLAAYEPAPEMEGAVHWCNHLVFNPGGTRFSFLHRYRGPKTGGSWITRFFTANLDGDDLFLLNPEHMTSHYDWRTDDEILAWARHGGVDGYWLFTDRSREARRIGETCFNQDGHCSFSPDGRWMLTDTYPDRHDQKRTLILYRWPDGPRIDIGRFYSPNPKDIAQRCDLHPRWRRDGNEICIDSVHEGSRQMYLLHVYDIVSK